MQFYLAIILPWAGLPREGGIPPPPGLPAHKGPPKRQSPLEFLNTNCLTENVHSHCRIICSVIYCKTPFLTFYNYHIIGAIGKFYDVRGPTGKFSHAWPARNLSQLWPRGRRVAKNLAISYAMLDILKAVWVILDKEINLTFYMATWIWSWPLYIN